jgi:hypothetical protein
VTSRSNHAAAPHGFSFCESVWATSSSRWHIRILSQVGRKPSGGIDTPFLCGTKVPHGWDLNVEITEHHLAHTCPLCVAHYRALTRTP